MPASRASAAHRTALPQVLWDVAIGQPICGSPAHNQNVSCVKFFRQSSTKVITAGNYNLQVQGRSWAGLAAPGAPERATHHCACGCLVKCPKQPHSRCCLGRTAGVGA
jgi:hypothetical protein